MNSLHHHLAKDPTRACLRAPAFAGLGALRPLAFAVACLFSAAPGRADSPGLPSGLQVMQGQASSLANGRLLTVTNSANAILNWQQFSIGAGNTVRFEQAGTTSQVLNRVVGNDPSTILGSLTSNGRVWLQNPYGVLFGAGARIDVAGLVATTLNINDTQWLAQRYSLQAGSGPGMAQAQVVNQGELRTAAGGQLMLIGTAGVRNEGLISAPGGQVLLAAGSSVDLVDSALPHLAVRVAAPQGEVLNLGQVLAAGGRVDLYAAVVNQQGIVRADGLSASGGHAGQVTLTGSQASSLAAGSSTSADASAVGANAGRVLVDGGAGANLVTGRVSATSSTGQGGTVTLLGRHLGLLDGAQVDVSGHTGGGDAWLGGGVQGRDAGLRNSQALYMAPGASVRADATGAGNGGRIVLWSDKATRVYGSLSARGGALDGDGGLIETSGGWLDAQPLAVRTDAPRGKAGLWLLDPDDIYITSGAGSDIGITGGPNFSSSTDPATLHTRTIEAALMAGNNVSVSTGNSDGSGMGDIRVASAVLSPNLGSAVSLTLNADRNITVDSSTLASTGAPLTIRLNANQGDTSSGGAVALSNSILRTRGGDININGEVLHGANPLRDGVNLASSLLDAGTGSIRVVGNSHGSTGESAGVAVVDNTSLSAARISLIGYINSDADANRTGVKLAGQPITASLGLTVIGSAQSGVYRALSPISAVDVLSALQVGVVDGPPGAGMTITGTMNEGLRSATAPEPALPRFAVGLRGAGAKITGLGGASISISGDALSPNDDHGVYAAGTLPAFVDASRASRLSISSGSGRINLSGEWLAPEAGPLTLAAGSELRIDAATLSGKPSQVLLSGNTVSIGTSGARTQLIFGDATQVSISGQTVQLGAYLGQNPFFQNFTNPPIVVNASADELRHALAEGIGSQGPVPAKTTLSTGGTISLFAVNLVIGQDTTLHSTAGGDAIVAAGIGEASNLFAFVNQSGSTALATPNGRWLVYALEPDNKESVFVAGGLQASFRQYGARPGGTAPAESGSAFLFEIEPRLSMSAGYERAYNGGTNVDLTAAEIALTGLRGGDRVTGTLAFADKNVGTAKPLLLNAEGTGFADVDGRPVYGYRFDDERLVGSIRPKGLDITTVAARDKVYDGSATAVISGVSLAGLVAGDTVTATAIGRFEDRNAGSGKLVTASDFNLSGADAGNYALHAVAASTRASISKRGLTASGAVASSKVYDGNNLALVDGALSLSGVLGEDVVSATAASGRFSDKNVGRSKTVTLSAFSLAGSDAGNYELLSGRTTASISAKPVSIDAANAASKVYDGNANAQSVSVNVSGFVEGDAVGASGSGSFADKNVGTGKTVTLSSFTLTGSDARNYQLNPLGVGEGGVVGFVSHAEISAATLRYVADPLILLQGSALPTLGGSVTGFVGEETLASATTGTLRFSSPLESTSTTGRFAINGSGLSAANYSLLQAAANASALTIQALPVEVAPLEATLIRAPLAAVLLQATATSAASGRALDVVQSTTPGGTGDRTGFTSLDLSNMSQETVAGVLAARDQYKKTIFAQAISRLEQNPGLADAPGCASAEQAASGQCLMVTPITSGLNISNARVVERAPVAVPPALPATPATPAPSPGSAAAAAAPAPQAAPPAAAGAPLAIAAQPELQINLPAPRQVRTATLPQIERKIAVLIGIDQYTDPRIPNLNNAVADARAVAAALESNLGYQTLVLANPTRATIFRTLNQLAAEVGPADSVVLYYAGHGELVEKTGLGYWPAADADASRPETWISNADVGRMLRQLPASQLAMVSDSCFSGSLVSGDRIRGVSGTQDPGALLSRRAAVVMSSGGNEPVFDSGKNGHSTFAWSLMQSLEQVSGWKPGSTLFEQVRFAVARQLPQRPQYGASQAGGHEAGADYVFERRQLEGLAR